MRATQAFIVSIALLQLEIVAATSGNVTSHDFVICYGDTSSGNCIPCNSQNDCNPYYSAADIGKVICGGRIAGNGTTNGCSWRV